MILPNLIWIFFDRRLWTTDTALYGFNALELHHLLAHDPSHWIERALSIGPKPPIVPWLGQFLVPIGLLAGNIDAGLLLLTFLSQAVALAFLFEALFEYSKSEWIALTGCAGAASAPLFIDVSKQLYVQPVQLAAVCWFIYIMARSKRWDALVILLQLTTATCVAMLATMSSPAFCVIAGAVALSRAIRKLVYEKTVLSRRHAYHLALAAPVFLVTLFWYRRHLFEAIGYGGFSFHYIYGGLMGAGYLQKLWTWTSFLFRFGLTTWVAAVLLLWNIVILSRKSQARRDMLLEPLLVGVGQISLALAVLASSEHQTSRYPIPALGFVVVILVVSLTNIGKAWLTRSILAAFLLQFVVVNLIAFGYVKYESWYVRPIQTAPGRESELLDAITDATGTARGDVVLVTSGLRIFSFMLKYHAAKKPDAFRAAGPDFTSAEFVLTRRDVGADIDIAWRELMAAKPAYFVVLSDALRRAQREKWGGSPHGWSAIMEGAVEISERVIADGEYELQSLPGYPEIEVYKRVDLE